MEKKACDSKQKINLSVTLNGSFDDGVIIIFIILKRIFKKHAHAIQLTMIILESSAI